MLPSLGRYEVRLPFLTRAASHPDASSKSGRVPGGRGLGEHVRPGDAQALPRRADPRDEVAALPGHRAAARPVDREVAPSLGRDPLERASGGVERRGRVGAVHDDQTGLDALTVPQRQRLTVGVGVVREAHEGTEPDQIGGRGHRTLARAGPDPVRLAGSGVGVRAGGRAARAARVLGSSPRRVSVVAIHREASSRLRAGVPGARAPRGPPSSRDRLQFSDLARVLVRPPVGRGGPDHVTHVARREVPVVPLHHPRVGVPEHPHWRPGITRREAQVWSSAWKLAAGSSRPAALASDTGRGWCDMPLPWHASPLGEGRLAGLPATVASQPARPCRSRLPVTRQTTSPTSSATRSEPPSGPSATPTGRP